MSVIAPFLWRLQRGSLLNVTHTSVTHTLPRLSSQLRRLLGVQMAGEETRQKQEGRGGGMGGVSVEVCECVFVCMCVSVEERRGRSAGRTG